MKPRRGSTYVRLAARDSGPYRFTVKLTALLAPATVVTLTFSEP